MVTTYAGRCVQSKFPTESQGSAPLGGGGCRATGRSLISIQMNGITPTSPAHCPTPSLHPPKGHLPLPCGFLTFTRKSPDFCSFSVSQYSLYI